MATKGLLTMLLHWATNCNMTHQRRAAAEAMFNDLLDRNLGAIDDTDEMWHAFRSFINENKLNVLLAEKPASAKSKGQSIAKDTSLCVMITNLCMYLFANREKCQDLHACLAKHLKLFETRINEVILTGKVGKETNEDEEQAMKLETDAQQAIVQRSGSSSLGSNPAQTNLASADVNNTSSGSHQTVKRMMKLERVFQRAAEQTNGTNKKRKLVEA